MAEQVFILRSRFGRAIYVLRERELEVTDCLLGRSRVAVYPLTSISADYEVRRIGHLRLLLVLAIPILIGVGVYRLLGLIEGFPHLIRVYALGLAAPFFIVRREVHAALRMLDVFGPLEAAPIFHPAGEGAGQ